jgi:putative addiction module killer protein
LWLNLSFCQTVVFKLLLIHSELRIHYGPGYRVYFQRRGNTIIVLLCGGNKSSQAKDIKAAKQLANEWSE